MDLTSIFFKLLLTTYGIKSKHITVKNPQANAILERIHQVVGDMLRSKDLENYTFIISDPWSDMLANIAWAIRNTVHTTLDATPGQLVFGRDMIFHDTFKANWQIIHARKAKMALKSNIRENSKRSNYKYVVGDYAYITSNDIKRKLSAQNDRPYRINIVYTNGTVKIQRGSTEEQINIRRLIPFKGTT